MNLARLLVVSPLALFAPTAAAQADLALFSGLKARSIGPACMSGRVAAIDVVAADPNVVWVGAATGGVFKSTNQGLTWTAVFDDQNVAAIGAIAIDPRNPDVVWVGTGEGNPRNSASVGDGIYKTTDGGKTWQHLGLRESERIHRIVLHPSEPDTAWAGALGRTWGDGEERGVFKTTDGGKTWRKVLYVDVTTGCADLVADPRDPRKLFASMWHHRRWPWFFQSGGPGSGLFLSRDGGETWKRLGKDEGLPDGDLGRIGLAIARSSPDVVYALVEAKDNVLLRSKDGGRKFEVVNKDKNVAPRPFYYADIRVDPQDPDRVYSLHSNLTVSDDGGRTFRTIGRSVHPDHHALWIHPESPHLLVNGNDGGVAVSTDHGASWRFVPNLPLAQFYHLALDDQVPFRVYGGLQDNGSWVGPSAVWESGGIRNHHWQEVFFGDGFATVPDPSEPAIGYAMSQGGYVARFDLRTGERKSIRPSGPAGVKLRFNWNAAIALDPFAPGTVYYGSQLLHRSKDRGDSWEITSPDLTTDNKDWQKQAESGGLTLDVTNAENYCTILTIAPSPVERGTIWVGTDDGRLQVTRDGGAAWSSVEANLPGLPKHTWCPHVEASKFDAGTAFAVFDDHRRSNFTPYVYRTDDWGKTWQSLATPDLRGYAHCLEQDPHLKDLLYLGTELGLWISRDGGKSWQQWKHGLPTVAVNALAVHARDHALVIATHGRALYVVDDVRPLRAAATAFAAKLHLLPPGDAQQYRVAQPASARFTGDAEFRGENRAYGALIDVWLGHGDLRVPEIGKEPEREAAEGVGEAGDKDKDDKDKDSKDKKERLVVEVFDAKGERLRRLKSEPRRGLNRVVWDLRVEAPRLPGRRDTGRRGGGVEVPPGDYRVQVTFRGETVNGALRVLADPRSRVSPEDRLANWTACRRATTLLESYAAAVRDIESARQDLGRVRAKLTPEDPDAEPKAESKALLDATRALVKTLDELELRFWWPADQTKGIPIGDKPSQRVSQVLGSLQSSWDAPTPAQLAYLTEAEQDLAAALAARRQTFDGPVAELRDKLRAAQVELLR